MTNDTQLEPTAEVESSLTDPTEPADERVFELALHPEDLALLLRQPELFHPNPRRRLATGRATRRSEIWHDTPSGELADAGLSLAQTHIATSSSLRTPIWRLQRLVPRKDDIAAPGAPPALIGETDSAPTDIGAPLVPVAAFDGNQRILRPDMHPPKVILLQGELRAVTAVRPVCRVSLSGDGASALALQWAGIMRLSVPQQNLAGEALVLAGRAPPHRPLGAPALVAEQSVSEGFAAVVAHLAGVMVHYAKLADGKHGPEPVHQMRVALRRLRSAISLFRRATSCSTLEEVNADLKQLGKVLGPPRDWDVFTLGTGARIRTAFADDEDVQDLLNAAERKRVAGYGGLTQFLESPAWRQLGIALAALATERPWEAIAAPESDEGEQKLVWQGASLSSFAARMLARRYRALLAQGENLPALPIAELHNVRLAGKRLRYAAEFFAPLFPGRATKRFLRRMAVLQEHLGQLNDTSVAAELMAQLAGRSAARAGAIGVVRGYISASGNSGRARIERSWKRLLRLDCFWL